MKHFLKLKLYFLLNMIQWYMQMKLMSYNPWRIELSNCVMNQLNEIIDQLINELKSPVENFLSIRIKFSIWWLYMVMCLHSI